MADRRICTPGVHQSAYNNIASYVFSSAFAHMYTQIYDEKINIVKETSFI